MKTQKLLSVIAFLFLTTSIFSQEESVKTNINKDTLKVLIKNELTEFFDKRKSDKVGVFIKSTKPILIYLSGASKEYKDVKNEIKKDTIIKKYKDRILDYFEEGYKSVSNDIKQSNKKLIELIDLIEKSNIDTKQINEIIKLLKTEDIKRNDSLRKVVATKFGQSKITSAQFNETINNLNSNLEELLNKEIANLMSVFGTNSLNNIKSQLKDENLIFVEEIGIEIYEGVIADLKVKLTDGSIFANKTGISLTRIRKYGPRKLFEINGNNRYIYLKDVLTYSSYPGKSYLPEDISLIIEKDEERKELNINNDLKSYLDFRIYTDFLGLIDEASNGIVNFEASSKIYISPSPLRGLFKWDYHFFKDVKPYVSYSRFDNDNKSIKSSVNTNDPNNRFEIDDKLDLLQNAFVKVGAEFNILQIKGEKEFPFSIHFPFRLELNMSETEIMDERISINSHVYGTGINASLRRFNNFGLNLGFSFDWISPRFSSEKIIEVKNFKTLGFDSELFFYGNKEKSSAIFLRLSTRRLNGQDKNFSMIQVGYKKAFSFSKTE